MRVSNAPLYGPSAFTLTATSTMEFEAGGRAATGPATMPSASAPAATVAMRRRFTGVLLGRTVGSGGPGAWTRSDRWFTGLPAAGHRAPRCRPLFAVPPHMDCLAAV